MLELGSLLSTTHEEEGEGKGERARQWQGVRKGEAQERRVSLWKPPEADKEEPCSPPEEYSPTRCHLLLQGRLVLGRDSIWIDRILFSQLPGEHPGRIVTLRGCRELQGYPCLLITDLQVMGTVTSSPLDSNAHCKVVLRVTGYSYCLGWGLLMSSWCHYEYIFHLHPTLNQRECTCI